MKVDIKVPPAGESVIEGDIARWFKADGDRVEKDEPILEMETDKASTEIPSPETGRLSILVAEGETVKVGQVIGHIDTEAAAATDDTKATPPKEDEEEDEEEDAEEDPAKHSTVYNISMPSPAARKLITENKLSAKDIPASGKGTRVTKADVLDYLEKLKKEENVSKSVSKDYRESIKQAIIEQRGKHKDDEAAPAPAPAPVKPPQTAPPVLPTKAAAPAPAPVQPSPVAGSRGTRIEKMSRLRRTIADRLVKAQQTAALLTTFNEVDMSGIMDIRTKYKEEFKTKHNVGLGFMSFFTKAVCAGLKAFPVINGRMEGDSVVYHDYCDIGIAVATPRGLVVPIIRNAESLSLRDIESTIVSLAKRGRDNELSIEEMSGGTFSITNGGTFGSMLSTPIVNFPQSAILGMHNIVQRPVAVNGQVVIRPIMYLAVTYDHRIIDGAEAVQFLVKIKNMLEDPTRLLLDL